MLCKNCSAELEDGANICPDCGLLVDTSGSSASVDTHAPESEVVTFTEERPSPTSIAVEHTPPKKKLSPTKGLIIAAAVIAVVALVTAIVLIVTGTSVSGLALSSLKLTDDFNERLDSTPIIVAGTAAGCVKNGTLSADFSYTDFSSDVFSGTLALMSNAESRTHLLTLNANIHETPLDARLFFSDKALALQSSIVSEDYYGITFDTFASDFTKFADMFGIPSNDTAELSELVDMLKSLLDGTYAIEMDETVTTATDEIWQSFATTLESEKSKPSVTFGDRTVTSKCTSFSIPIESIIELLQDYLELFRTNEALYNALVQYIGQGGRSYSYIYTDADTFLNDMEGALSELSGTLTGDVTARFYTYKNKFCLITLTANLESEGEQLYLSTNLELGLDITDDWVLRVYYDNGYESDSLSATWSYKTGNGGGYNVFTLNNWSRLGEDPVSLSSIWDKSDGSFTLTFEVGTETLAELSGVLVITDSGFELDIDAMPELELKFTGTEGLAEPLPAPEYVNLDEWSIGTILMFAVAIERVYSEIYSY